MKFSVIIALSEINAYCRETVGELLKCKRNDFEVIVLPNAGVSVWRDKRVIVHATGRVSPGEKRDMGSGFAHGRILVFLDDDSYPTPDFFYALEKDFVKKNVVAVGGPGITPPTDSFFQRVSGAVFLSRLSGGYPERYLSFGKKKYVDDWPSVNLSVLKFVFDAVGGFGVKYWPGEDTFLCLKLLEHGRILYDPAVVVYHHRRSNLKGHLMQVGNYGLHRGYFAKRYPLTSFRLHYFLPSFLVLFLVLGFVVSYFTSFTLYFYGVGIYLIVLLLAFFDILLKGERILVGLVTVPYIILTHLWYGVRFMQGLMVKRLVSRLR